MPNKIQKKKVKKVNNVGDIIKELKGFKGICQKLTKDEIKEVLTNLLEVIENKLGAKESVEFREYFVFSTRLQPAKEMTMQFGKDKGKKKKIPAKFVPVCKFSPLFKKGVA